MLMHTLASRFAHQLLDSRAEGRQLAPLSTQASLSLADGYDIARCILDRRIALGEVPVGRKIGFANRTLWGKYGAHEPIAEPIWAPMFDSTVRYAQDNHGLQSLLSSLQPRLEPGVVFRLRKAPSPEADLMEIADCIEWMAHGIELVVCPFPDWQFDAAEAVAAFGLHGTLVIGEQRTLVAATRRNLASLLAASSVSLSQTGGDETLLCDAGFGNDVLGSPVHALLNLHRLLRSQPQFAALAAGEIISSGTWIEARPVRAGQTWSTAFSGVGLPGMTLSFV